MLATPLSDRQMLLILGTPVRTADGAELGTITEIAGRFFKIHVPLRRDYWIDGDDVDRVDFATDVAWLTFPKSELRSHKVAPEDAHA